MATQKSNNLNRPTQVLALGMLRTGTSSICEALALLGYENVYHSLNALGSPEDFHILNRAADATFSNLPTYTGKPFTRTEWDEIFGPCDAITDIACVFAPQLIEAYPEAKVVVVRRDYDRWYKSMNEHIFGAMWGPGKDFMFNTMEPMMGSVTGISGRKCMLGYFEGENIDQVRANARRIYERHYERIRELVPPERLLEFDYKDGWKPLCDFLGKDIPETSFPHINEAEAMRAKLAQHFLGQTLKFGAFVAPWVGAGIAAVGCWAYVRYQFR